MAEITEELRVLVTAEVDKAIKNLNQLDRQSRETEKMFKSLGGTISSALSIKAIINFASKSVEAYRVQKEAVSVLNSVLDSTGATAWTSSEQLQEMAASLQKVTNYGDETVISMQNVLLGFRNIKGDQFEAATKAILDMATVMGMDLKSAAQVVGKALDDPAHGLDSLRRQGFQFTEAQKNTIQAMLDAGDAAGAQKIILDELEATYGEAAEAAADMGTQIKNSLGDLLEGYGKVFTAIGAGTGVLTSFRDAVDFVADALNNFDEYFAKTAGGDKYKGWFDSLTDTRKLQEAEKQLNSWLEKLQDAKKRGNSKDIDDAIVNVDMWRKQVALLKQSVSEAQKLQAEENARKDAENEINELMYSISQNYEKLGKDDPSIQLKIYEKELEKIKKQRRDLSKPVADSNGNLINTTEAMQQLDVLEKNIKKKIANLEIDGKKTWHKWLSDILKVDESLFETGKKAADLYLGGLERSLENAEGLSKILGKKFSATDIIDSQLGEIEAKISSLLNIDPPLIDRVFPLDELQQEGSALNELYEAWKKLQGKKADSALKDLQKEIDDLSRSDFQRWLETTTDGIDLTAEKVEELKEKFYELKEKGITDLSEKIGSFAETALIEIEGLDAGFAKTLGNMVASASELSFNGALDGFKEFGRALGEGEDAADALSSALGSMALQILDQLPLLFMQAGLQLIAQGQWPLGLGLMAAGLGTAALDGYVNGKIDSAKETNALGGVYGAGDYSAFAKGGTFTNTIVQSPTFFRFAKGSGFGTGLMGEAGPEAIMPLTRGSDGSLGVSASGIGGGNVEVNIPVTVYSDEPVEVNDTTDEDGQRKIEIMVGSMINSHLANGKADKALKLRYGLKAQGV